MQTMATIYVDINYDITNMLHPNKNAYYRHTDTVIIVVIIEAGITNG